MPTYEYHCEKCGHHFELFQGMTEPPLWSCPKDICPRKRWGRGRVKRAIGVGAGLIFKGGGFYTTDYRSEGYKAAARKEQTAASPAPDSKAAPAAGGTSPPASPPSKKGSGSG